MSLRKTALFEVLLLVMAIVAFSYLAAETNVYFSGEMRDESPLVLFLRDVFLSWLSHGLVSAQGALWTCLENVNGSFCQEYPSDVCDESCTEPCFQGSRDTFAACTLGTCFDQTHGTCSANTPRTVCEENGGEWTDSSDGVPASCQPGCCLLNGEAQFVSETTCNSIAAELGYNLDGEINRFDPTVTNELACLVLSESDMQGACVLDDAGNGKYNCRHETTSTCASLGGTFHAGALCTNPDLNTVCEKTEETICVDDADEVYFVDSCGNAANIYDFTKRTDDSYWSERISKGDSCELTDGNQARCGNCNFLLGSTCGIPGEGDKAPSRGEFVCKSLTCIDENGNERKNGESWCAFDSQIGVHGDGNDQKSVDVPGSRQYRQVCFEGEVRTEACADYRGELCVEQRNEEADFSAAACRVNQWQTCLSANTDAEKLNKCETHTDCVIKEVKMGDFAFDSCVPKYPPGFNLKETNGGEVGEGICSLATQKCTVVEVKRLFGGWKCESNCECLKPTFSETMNNLCVSLGDCGGHVNIAGEYTDDGYQVKGSGSVRQSYIAELKGFATPKQNQFVEPLSGEELSALFGVSQSTFENDAAFAEFLGTLGLGVIGIDVLVGASLGLFSGVSDLGTGLTNLQTVFGATDVTASWASFANAAGGLAAGAAIGYLVGNLIGLEGEALTTVTIIGAVTGIAASLGAFGADASVFFSGAWAATVILVIAIAAIILHFLGIGKVRERTVSFTCMPWQPPAGGDRCNECNTNPLGCSAYACQSLGQNCEFINEGTSNELCVDISPDDTTPPAIQPNENALTDGFSYASANENGVSIEQNAENDGCVEEYKPVTFGISLDEPAQCKIETTHTSGYDEMGSFFDNSNLYAIDHETTIAMPTLESIGVSGIDPDRRGDYELFIRCQDSSGNANIAEYAVTFCVAPATDLTPPIIDSFVPEQAFASLNATEKQIQFYTNEPADCKWSFQDEEYESMDEIAVCNNEITEVTPDGWACAATLPIGEENETRYYFKCADQPWLAHDDDDANDAERNINTQSTIYTITRTTEPLQISSIEPHNETIIVSGEPASVTLEIASEGGVDNSALCTFSFNPETGIFTDFFETGTATHTQEFNALFAGEYNIGLQCTDQAGNTASETAQFDIVVDDEGPTITRAYDSGGTLTIITDEESVCAYDTATCGFTFNNATEMSGTGFVHSTQLEQGLLYHVKCKDTFENVGSCLVVTAGY